VPDLTSPRRTPRKSAGNGPSRLGQDDNWGSVKAGEWISDTVITAASKSEELYKERVAFVAELNAKEEPKSSSIMDKYKAVMAKHTYPATVVQSVVLTVLGYVIGDVLSKETPTPEAASQWAGWGVIGALTSLPYLTWLSGITFVKSSEKLNGLCKAVFNQALFTQFMNCLFLSYFALLKGEDPVAKIKADYVQLAKDAASVWLPSDLINLNFIPVEAQVLWNSSVSVFWTVFLAMSKK